jgi:RimJ/RimL family protein N-acetyltransferase
VFHRSARLLLRPIWPEDWRGVHRGIADEGVVRNLARAPWPYSEEDARRFAEREENPKYPRFLVTRAADAQILGCVGFNEASPTDHAEASGGRDAPAVELGYWIARLFWGQGFATEAGAAALAVARALGHRHAVASHFLDNPASGRVLAKLGFEPTGRIVMHASCGRGEEAPAALYRMDLAKMASPVRAGPEIAKRSASRHVRRLERGRRFA